jgi:glycosyltransferase involved in cell wall biosynthesis
MKIIHIITGLNIGGAERALQKLIYSDEKNEYNIRIISLTSTGTIGAQLKEKGYPVDVLNMKNALYLPRTIYRLVIMLRLYKPDIVQCWLYHADLIGGVSAKLAGIKHVLWGIRSTELKKGSHVTAIIRRFCALLSYIIPTQIICVAEASKFKHISLGYSEKKMVVIGNGFDISKLNATEADIIKFKREANLKKAQVVIGSIGRFSSIKGQDIFIKSAGLLIRNYPNLIFLMIGRDLQKDNTRLMKWINDTGYPNCFILLGERSDIPVCLAAMDIFCLHSRSEGFPNVLGEAMAMGLPCVTTDVGDAALLLGEAGLIIERNSPEALAHGLVELITNSSEKNISLGKAAKNRIENKFSIKQSYQKFTTLYHELLGGEK